MYRARRAKPLLGTIVDISLCASSIEQANRFIDAAFEEVQRLQRIFSSHDPESEVSRLNFGAHLVPQSISRDLSEVVKFALTVSSLSCGVFDVTVGDVLIKHGLLNVKFLEDRGTDDSASYRDIQVLDSGEIFFKRPIIVDLGGVAKGYIVDRCLEVLSRLGAEEIVVNAGGDIKVSSKEGISISIRDPVDPTIPAALLSLYEGAIATSAGYYSGNSAFSPMFNRLNGSFWKGSESISVLADSCMIADALTKVVALDRIRSSYLLQCYRAKLIFIDESGENEAFSKSSTICR